MHFPPLQALATPRKPILRIFGLSVDATMAILLTHVGIMVLLALGMALAPKSQVGAGMDLARGMVFDTHTFRIEDFAKLFLYPFRHDILSQHLLFVIEMLLLFFCGRNLENQIGRRAMICYYAFLVVFPPLLLLALSKVAPIHFVLDSSFYLTVAICLSYLLFVPQQHFHGGVHLRFLTWLLIGFCAVFFIAKQDWQSLGHVTVALSVSLLYLECIGAGNGAGIFYLFRPVPIPLPVEEGAVPKDSSLPAENYGQSEAVDAVLEKISKKGIRSLNKQERRILLEASKRLENHD